MSAHAPAFAHRYGPWLEGLGLRDRPWLIFGSAPDPTVPAELLKTHARIDINNAGRTAAALGLGRADLTVRAKHKSWDEHRKLDTRGLLWLHEWPDPLLRLLILTKPHLHVGTVRGLPREERDAVVAEVSGASVETVGSLGKVTNGIAAACYGLGLGVPHVVLAGISLSQAGHSYDERARVRKQADEDAVVLRHLRDRFPVFTSEPGLAAETGLKLWGQD